MTPSCRFVVAILAVAVILAGAPFAGAADAPKPGEAVARPMGGQPFFYGLPGYYQLQNEAVQKEIELVADQKEKLKEIAKEYTESMQQDAKIDWTKIRELPADEQKKKYDEMRENYNKRTADVKAKVEKVLLPHQLELLKQIELRGRAASMLYMPNVLDQIGMTDAQKDKLRQVREELQTKMQQLQQETLEKTLGVLTAEQRKKLEEISSQGGRGLWGGAVEVKPPPKQ